MLTGFREDIAMLLAHMDVFVLSSVSTEGVPQALTQAMAMQRAVVATRVGGIPEVIKHEQTGLLTSPRDSRAIAENVCTLLLNKDLRERMGTRARGFIERFYSLDAMLDQTERCYWRLGLAQK